MCDEGGLPLWTEFGRLPESIEALAERGVNISPVTWAALHKWSTDESNSLYVDRESEFVHEGLRLAGVLERESGITVRFVV